MSSQRTEASRGHPSSRRTKANGWRPSSQRTETNRWRRRPDDAQRCQRTAGRLDVVTRETTVGIGSGAGEFATTDMVLNIGPQHPATHGVLRLRLTLDGESIVRCEPIIGYMHRGAEKLFEVRDYRQIVVLANRHDWLSAFANELGVVMAAERMLGMEVPVRAIWARTLMAELNRVLNHLMFLGSYPLEVGAITPIFYAFRERETIQQVMEEISGGRMHYMFNRVGGLKEDLPAGWLARVSAAVSGVRSRLPALRDMVLGNEIFQARTRGVGVLSTEAIHAYGVSGPIARASGVDFDLRRDEPYLAYPELFRPGGTGRVVTRTEGDCYARFSVLSEQVSVSLDLADVCVDQLRSLPTGPINVKLPKVLKVPEGHTYCWTENPLGINGYYLVSRGEKTPWRLKLRSASFNNIAVLPELLAGCLIADMVAILGSMFFVVGDIDK
jgi:NADH-quinone oxidoreductase subunit D